MSLKIPRTLSVTAVAVSVAVAAAVAFSACTPCPPINACYFDLGANPDGGNPLGCYRRQQSDGAVTCTADPCPAVPPGCPQA